MSNYPVHTIQSAPQESQPALREVQRNFGMIPNVAGVMAGSPVLLKGFLPLFGAVHAGSFSEAQIQTLLLTNAVTNQSPWPVAFHTALALKNGVSADDVQALREARAPSDPALAALANLTRGLIQHRGQPDQRAIEAFVDAGFRPPQVLEVIAVLAASIMTNYSAHVGKPALEPELQAHAWRA